jgi:hypothetical protein
MSSARIEPEIPASERSKTHTLDGAATGIGTIKIMRQINKLGKMKYV